MLRVPATIRHGYVPASTLVSRLQGSARQNELTKAIQEYGRIAKTISILRYRHKQRAPPAIHHLTAHGSTITSDRQRRLSPAVRDHIKP